MGLTSEAIRALARNLFPGFWERGISANQALRELRELGLGYRRTDFLADYREGKSRWEDEIRVRFVNRDAVPSERILVSEYHGVPDKYSFVFRYWGENIDTGERMEGYIYYHRDTLTTRRRLEEDAASWLSEQSDQYGLIIAGTQIVAGYINPVWA